MAKDNAQLFSITWKASHFLHSTFSYRSWQTSKPVNQPLEQQHQQERLDSCLPFRTKMQKHLHAVCVLSWELKRIPLLSPRPPFVFISYKQNHSHVTTQTLCDTYLLTCHHTDTLWHLPPKHHHVGKPRKRGMLVSTFISVVLDSSRQYLAFHLLSAMMQACVADYTAPCHPIKKVSSASHRQFKSPQNHNPTDVKLQFMQNAVRKGLKIKMQRLKPVPGLKNKTTLGKK